MAARVCVLGSGSSGNCTYIGNGSSALLVDAGFSAREILKRLTAAEIDPGSITGVVVSHEHSDHSKGVGVIGRKLGCPVFLNERTYARVKNVIGEKLDIHHFKNGVPFEVGSIGVEPFAIPHDAVDPSAFLIRAGGARIGHVTDIGRPTHLILQRVAEADYLVMEANHDPDMLAMGPYPWELKQRIASRTGHLSNGDCMEMVAELCHTGLQGVTFAHLSETNNNADLVKLMAGQTLDHHSIGYHVARQASPGPVVTVE